MLSMHFRGREAEGERLPSGEINQRDGHLQQTGASTAASVDGQLPETVVPSSSRMGDPLDTRRVPSRSRGEEGWGRPRGRDRVVMVLARGS